MEKTYCINCFGEYDLHVNADNLNIDDNSKYCSIDCKLDYLEKYSE